MPKASQRSHNHRPKPAGNGVCGGGEPRGISWLSRLQRRAEKPGPAQDRVAPRNAVSRCRFGHCARLHRIPQWRLDSRNQVKMRPTYAFSYIASGTPVALAVSMANVGSWTHILLISVATRACRSPPQPSTTACLNCANDFRCERNGAERGVVVAARSAEGHAQPLIATVIRFSGLPRSATEMQSITT